jgi:clan AA aspartic protease (TIGR02281 family)
MLISAMRTAIFLLALLTCELVHAESVRMMSEHGTFVVPVVLNNSVTLKFTIDSGAADVSVPADVFSTLVRSGTVTDDDLRDKQRYRLADGSEQVSQRFRIRSLKVGAVVLHDVIASVAPAAGEPLLGQSFLARLESWSIDNTTHILLLNESSTSEVSTGPRRPTPTSADQPNEQVFLKALAFLITGDDAGRIVVVNRSECVLKIRVPDFFVGPAGTPFVLLHLNNVDLHRSRIQRGPRGTIIKLRGDRVVELPPDVSASGATSWDSSFDLTPDTDEVARVRRAIDYVYAHGCKESKSSF